MSFCATIRAIFDLIKDKQGRARIVEYQQKMEKQEIDRYIAATSTALSFRLREAQSCVNCIFLLRQSRSTIGGEVEFDWHCLKYDRIIVANSGSLPICAMPLPICPGKTLEN